MKSVRSLRVFMKEMRRRKAIQVAAVYGSDAMVITKATAERIVPDDFQAVGEERASPQL